MARPAGAGSTWAAVSDDPAAAEEAAALKREMEELLRDTDATVVSVLRCTRLGTTTSGPAPSVAAAAAAAAQGKGKSGGFLGLGLGGKKKKGGAGAPTGAPLLDAEEGEKAVVLCVALARSASRTFDIRIHTILPERRGAHWRLGPEAPWNLNTLVRVEAAPPNAEGVALDFALVFDAGPSEGRVTRAYLAAQTRPRNLFLAALLQLARK